MHYAKVASDQVDLQMQDVASVQVFNKHCFLDTGSPHHVQIENDLDSVDVVAQGADIRYNTYGEAGSNVNFVQKISDTTFRLRTYERGVEDETLSCGTGATAAAIAMFHTKQTQYNNLHMLVEGGALEVRFELIDNTYKNVFLKGKASQVFKGEIAW